ncbi:thiamine pyrophosphate-binding protein [Arthrobacter sp. Y-9]|uniref:thiamine pyrophosphate-binding protein n=1 Tax=Arthrobacter sp. Y-9 TaxID=3039385 RepID=UPI00241C3EF2|nr:thiamine pyrophosphate-binding protein [Arthrobacter sp. Y-9]WFR82770.1 thiamine pyrophosphate-binding protein [Arthrobacter sp. Y-9]
MNTITSPEQQPIEAGPHANAGLAIMTTLSNYGIDTIFGIPGTHNLEFYRHLAPLGIHPVTSRHEQGAGYAADGWAQQTGLPGVVITTSGPGLLNALSAAGTAYCESRPLLLLSPGPALGDEFADRGALHETKDSTAAAGAIVEWSLRATSAEEAVEAIHRAFALFRGTRPRPVHLEVPLDVLEGPAALSRRLLAARPAPDPSLADDDAVATAARLLAGAAHPVILAGGGSLPGRGALRALAESLPAPVVTTLNGKGALPESHPLSLGSDIRLPAAQALCNDADVLLVVGSKVGEAELWGGEVAPRGTVIRVDILERQMDTNLTADVRLVGHTAAVLPQLLEAVRSALSEAAATATTGHEPRGSGLTARLIALRTELKDAGRAMAPDLAALACEIQAAVPADTIIAGDSSQITYFGTSTFIPQDEPHSFLYTPAYATLGYGLPAAIGAKVGAPDRPVVAVVGDGALMFAVQEFATAVEQGLDLVVVCVDNGGYAEIKQNEADRGIPPVGVELRQPDWAALATAFGGHGVSVSAPAEVRSAVEQALAAGGVQLVHVPLSIFSDARPGGESPADAQD